MELEIVHPYNIKNRYGILAVETKPLLTQIVLKKQCTL